MVRKSKSPTSNNDEKEVIVKQQHIKHYSGIIPHPEIVEGYEKNCPGATDRILAMTENQLKSSQEIELSEQKNINECRLTMLKSDIEYNKRGQIFGFVLLLTMIIGGFIPFYLIFIICIASFVMTERIKYEIFYKDNKPKVIITTYEDKYLIMDCDYDKEQNQITTIYTKNYQLIDINQAEEINYINLSKEPIIEKTNSKNNTEVKR